MRRDCPLLPISSPWPMEEAQVEKSREHRAASVATLDQRNELLSVALQPTREIDARATRCEPCGPGGSHQLIDIDGTWPQRAHDPLTLALGDLRQRLGAPSPPSGEASSGPIGSSGRPGSAPAPRRYRALVTRQAPCLMRLLAPAERGARGLPGTAKTSRLCSPAKRAAIKEPERSAASTTTPSETPEISRFRGRKSFPRGAKLGLR